MKVTVVLAVILVAYAQDFSGWTDVTTGDSGRFAFNSDDHSLEVMTESTAGLLAFSFFQDPEGGDGRGSVAMFFPGFPRNVVMYEIKHCTASSTLTLSEDLADADTKNWLFTMHSDGLNIMCNEETVLNMNFESDCSKEDYIDYYNEWPSYVQFDNIDSISVRYREADQPGESDGDTSCDVGKMKCADGGCIFEEYWCDGAFDCDDGSDEGDHCVEYTCDEYSTKCADGRHCISSSYFCDAERDCSDGSDEISSVCREQMPEPDGELVSIVDAEQSSTRAGVEESWGAHLAIDGDMTTLSTTNSDNPDDQWVKFTLDGMHCVRQIMWYYKGYTPPSTYTCDQDDCTCDGDYCDWAFVTVGVAGGGTTESGVPIIEDEDTDEDPADSDCKYGNTVLFTFSRLSNGVAFSELQVAVASKGDTCPEAYPYWFTYDEVFYCCDEEPFGDRTGCATGSIDCPTSSCSDWGADDTDDHEGWRDVQLGESVDFNLEEYPLMIRTDTPLGTNDGYMQVYFQDEAGEDRGGFHMVFTTEGKYWIDFCKSGYQFEWATALPDDGDDREWKFVLDRSDGIALVVYCNDVLVLRYELTDETCTREGWRDSWSSDMVKIKFTDDNASDSYGYGTKMDSESPRHKALKFGNSYLDYIMYQPDMTPLQNAFSVCSWVRSLGSSEDPSWLSYAASSSTNEILISDSGSYNHIFGNSWNLESSFSSVPSGTWYHYCYSWSLSSTTQTVYLNGEVIGTRYTSSGRTLTPDGFLVLGNDQNGSPGTGMADKYVFGGELYKLNFFSKELSSSEVREMARSKCSEVEQTYGDVRSIKWEDILERERNGDVTDIETECEARIQYSITYSIWDDEEARTTDRQYVQIRGTDGMTKEHICYNNFDVTGQDVTCVFESGEYIGDYRCVSLRTGGSDGIDLTRVKVEINGVEVHEFGPLGEEGEEDYFDLDNHQKLEFCQGECDEGYKQCWDGHCIPDDEYCGDERYEYDCRDSMNWDHRECYDHDAAAATHLSGFLVAVLSLLLIAAF